MKANPFHSLSEILDKLYEHFDGECLRLGVAPLRKRDLLIALSKASGAANRLATAVDGLDGGAYAALERAMDDTSKWSLRDRV